MDMGQNTQPVLDWGRCRRVRASTRFPKLSTMQRAWSTRISDDGACMVTIPISDDGACMVTIPISDDGAYMVTMDQ